MFKFSLDPTNDLFNRFLLFAEGDDAGEGGGEGEGDGGSAGVEGDAGSSGVDGGESGKSADGDSGKAASGADDDWRAGIQDEKLRDHAGRFTSVLDLVGKHYELRQQLSTAVQPLGKDPSDEQVTAYRKAIGIPETVEGYEFTVPEGHEVTDADKAFQSSTAEAFHKMNITSEQANGLNEWWGELTSAMQQAQIDGDKAFADESEAALKSEWPGEEFARNKTFADRAAAKVFGDQFDEVRNIETKDGRFILDHPSFIKMLAQYGREMQEGTLGNIMTDSERGGIDAEIAEIHKKIDQAQASGDRSLANTLYQQEQELYRKSYGAGPVVGADGRTA